MSVKNDKRAAKAKEIVAAALQLFASKGYAATSIEEIATAAGIGKSTIYEYYATKEKLFVEAIMTGADLLVEDLHAIAAETQDPVARLTKIAELFFKKQRPEFALESKLFIEVLAQTLLNGGAFTQQTHLIRQTYQRVVGIVTDFLLAGISRGQLRPDIARNAKGIAVNYLAYLDGIKLHSMLAEDFIVVRDQIDFHLRQLTRMIQVHPDDGETMQLL